MRIAVLPFCYVSSMDWRHLGAETPYYKLKFGKNFSNAVGIQLSAAATDAGEIRIPAGKDKGKVLNDDGIYDYYEESSYEEHSVWKKKIGAFVLGWLLHPSVGAYLRPRSLPQRHGSCG
jgi:hypothetical protein